MEILTREQEEGKRIVDWWKTFLSTVISVCTFGGSITFSVIVQNIADPLHLNPENLPTQARYDREKVRTFLAVGWVLFICNLGISCLLSSIVHFSQDEIVEGWKHMDKQKRRLWSFGNYGITWRWLLHTISVPINGLLITAFAVLSLAVVAYVEVVGWVGFAFTMMWAVVVFVIWIKQCWSMLKNEIK